MLDCHFSWQAQYLVMLDCQFFMLECDFLWQAQHLVMLECHFSLQTQHLVKCEYVARARNVVILQTKCVSNERKVTSANGQVRDDQLRVRIMFGSFSHHPPM